MLLYLLKQMTGAVLAENESAESFEADAVTIR
jgi:hypothetical protein